MIPQPKEVTKTVEFAHNRRHFPSFDSPNSGIHDKHIFIPEQDEQVGLQAIQYPKEGNDPVGQLGLHSFPLNKYPLTHKTHI